MKTEDILKGLSAEQQEELLRTLTANKQQSELDKRNAYESIRGSLARNVKDRVVEIALKVKDFRDWLDNESEGFKSVMAEYGKLRSKEQRGFTIVVDDFKFEVKSQDVKGFDERSELAAQRLMDFLGAYIEKSEKGKDDPMYQLCMNLLERNRNGKFNYTSISKLYHKVKPGETLNSIAEKRGVTVEQICRLNGYRKDKKVSVGQIIRYV